MEKQPDQPLHVVVMGVSGTGKTSVAEVLAQHMGVKHLEGDSLHPQQNLEKMSQGLALTDEDRRPWLEHIAEVMRQEAVLGHGLVVTCSSLRQAYRDILRSTAIATIVFAHLVGSRADIANRMEARAGHFFPSSLLESQLQTLEPLQPQELGFTINIAQPLDAEVQQILSNDLIHTREA